MESKHAIQQEFARRLLLGELIARNARKFPDKEAVIFGDTRLTYGEFNGRINRLAHAFQDMGVGKDDKVALLMPNCNQYLECYFALGKIGGVAVPLNFRLQTDEIVYIVNNADAVAYVVGEQFIDTVRSIQKDLPLVRQYISVTAGPVEGMSHYETLIRKYPNEEPLVLVGEDDPVFIMYTAGTTGRPKGAVLTHKSQVMMWLLAFVQLLSEPGVGNLWDFRVCSPAAALPPRLLWLLRGASCSSGQRWSCPPRSSTRRRSWRSSSGRRSTPSCSYLPWPISFCSYPTWTSTTPAR